MSKSASHNPRGNQDRTLSLGRPCGHNPAAVDIEFIIKMTSLSESFTLELKI
jgi:hypothetical protein